jgi:BirA family biotin operon repressor/biotin-[acetyl-CoA-carboxylase] ligase
VYISLYKAKCNVLGKDVDVLINGTSIPAQAIDIDENCNLIVKYENGEIAALGSGEISVRCIGQLDQ